MRNRTSGLRIPWSDALSVSPRDSTVSKVYFEVHMTCFLHTTRISNVDSIMFVNEIREMTSFELGKEIEKYAFRLVMRVESKGLRFDSLWGLRIFFLCSTLVQRRKTSFSISLTSFKLILSFIILTLQIIFYAFFHNFSNNLFAFFYIITEGKEEYDVTGRATYLQACRDSGVIPVSYFHRNLQQPDIDIKHHGLGPMGAKAIAIALVVGVMVNFSGYPVQ